MVQRVYITSGLVTISKPGIDALSPTGISYDYLSLDSRLSQFRPLLIGQASNVVISNTAPTFVSFGVTFAEFPHVVVVPYSLTTLGGEIAGVASDLMACRETGGSHIKRNVFYPYTLKNGFYLIDDFVADRPYVSLDLITYFVWEHV